MANIVFMGSPNFAVPSLRLLSRNYQVSGVVTQPDSMAGRGRHLTLCPVKLAATDLGLSVISPARLHDAEPMEQLGVLEPEVIIVVAFGQILKPEVLDLPEKGCINVHASVLPRHRGAAPVAAAIQAGDSESGVTLMSMAASLDTGPVLAQRATTIDGDDTTGSLTEKLSILGAEMLGDALPVYLSGEVTPIPQDEKLATYAPMLKKSDGHLDFGASAQSLARHVRAMHPWPGAFALREGLPFKILQARAVSGSAPVGYVIRGEGGTAVGTRDGLLQLILIQASGGRPMAPEDYARGSPDFISSTLQ